jgi:hypothetical protein
LDGNISAYARTVGPEEVFEAEAIHGNHTRGSSISFALKSWRGTYLRVDRDGVLSADSDAIGVPEMFMRSGNVISGDVALASHGHIVAAVNTRLSYLTTSFVPHWANAHLHEIYSALIMNLQNDAIYDVHVVTETNCTVLLNTVEAWARTLPNATVIYSAIREKFVCVPSPTGVQPTYKDFFDYAHEKLTGRLVLLANADIVFDDTLRLIAPERIMTGEIAFVLSVDPPPFSGAYNEVFHRECGNTRKCRIGTWQGPRMSWHLEGWSWDAYIFATPLPPTFSTPETNIVMNQMGAEWIAAYQFEAHGIHLYNPCEHIKAYHWHCQGGKMHDGRTGGHHELANILPCDYCPGMTMPNGYGKYEELCRSGVKKWTNQIPHNFVGGIQAFICCAPSSSCWSPAGLPTCKAPDDVNCVVWEFVGGHSFFSTRL